MKTKNIKEKILKLTNIIVLINVLFKDIII